MSPGEINAKYPEPVYRCRACRSAENLRWFGGTSCPVCDKPECSAALVKEIEDSNAYEESLDQLYADRYGNP
jgi:hypothetical protein